MSSVNKIQGHTARKRFGQNFLVAQNVIKSIIDAIAAKDGETIIEIGPGLGALTEPLLQRIPYLHVVEIDRDLIARLRSRYPPERLTIHQGDALEFDFGSIKRSGQLKIIGNLPYNISSPLLFHLVKFAPIVAEMHFMLQKEVVDRMGPSVRPALASPRCERIDPGLVCGLTGLPVRRRQSRREWDRRGRRRSRGH